MLQELYRIFGKEYYLYDIVDVIKNGSKENLPPATYLGLELFIELGFTFYYIECARGKIALFKVLKDDKVFECLDYCKPIKKARVYKTGKNNTLIKIVDYGRKKPR